MIRYDEILLTRLQNVPFLHPVAARTVNEDDAATPQREGRRGVTF
tara:strand:+ start:476 stop:610 length:135 start_codon:yes stop_codon:yes gene_type:complete